MSNVPPPQPPPPAWATAASPAGSRPSRGLAIVSLVIAFVAIGIAVGAWFRPLPKNEPPRAPIYSSQEVADAKAKVCAAYQRVNHAVLANTGRSGSNDSPTQLALAANARIALFDSGEYLLRVLGKAPATPADVAAATTALAEAYQELALDYLAEANDQKIQSSRDAIETSGSKVDKLCQ
ncbi:hypothetical protein MPRG_30170 [Mycobacterium paragordonae]|uniref:Alanine and proline rich membrane protein n=1 Tax=Mycobacterium paragordonae TaxID=1389713 RepID=A0ABQ1C602_9MYCO|nr:hypothetical protein MPRG_30170 [Mycobacterium paragordonae]